MHLIPTTPFACARKLRNSRPRSLLKPVGTFPARQRNGAPIFDLGGNVAEWAVTTDGKGKPRRQCGLPLRREIDCTAAPNILVSVWYVAPLSRPRPQSPRPWQHLNCDRLCFFRTEQAILFRPRHRPANLAVALRPRFIKMSP